MPRLPVASGQEIIAALKSLGFEQTRQTGSHVVVRRGSVGSAVPLHREVKKGTLAAIIRQCGISADDLIGALRR